MARKHLFPFYVTARLLTKDAANNYKRRTTKVMASCSTRAILNVMRDLTDSKKIMNVKSITVENGSVHSQETE
jgi:hypothetical protein